MNVAPDELVVVYNVKGLVDEMINYDTVITIEPWRKGIERVEAFRQNPVAMGEYISYLRTHLAIVFFAPMVIGGILRLFLINATLNFTVYASFLKSRVLIMYGIFVVFDIFFYISLKNKFVREVGL
ncbi:MAG TPA: hypothetical protein VEF53_01970 [Patescibacteria group bacterium]|nr:hypothetical protein [Patescibacteria group bacterium]